MRNYPLFIIDTSRQHGRGVEIDYLQCTAHDCPFVAEVSYTTASEYSEVKNLNVIQLFSKELAGLRLRIKVVDYPEKADKARIQSLLRKALKEVLERRKSREIDLSNINKGDMIKFLSSLHEQACEGLTIEPSNPTLRMSRDIISAIIEELT